MAEAAGVSLATVGRKDRKHDVNAKRTVRTVRNGKIIAKGYTARGVAICFRGPIKLVTEKLEAVADAIAERAKSDLAWDSLSIRASDSIRASAFPVHATPSR